MAKLDANGRPIYETADEYNKAHGTGSARHTYDSPEGDNYKHNTYKQTQSYQKAAEKQKPSSVAKNTKKIILIFVFVLIGINVGVVFSAFNVMRSTYNSVYDNFMDFEEEWITFEEDEGYGEYLGDGSTPLVEGFNTFSYEGQTITLPTTYQEISKLGFTLEEGYDEDYEIEPECYEHVYLNNEDGYIQVMIRVYNPTDEDLPIRQCVVDYFFVNNDAAYNENGDVVDFVFGDGLTLESSYEQLEAYFGTPYYHYFDHSEESYYYDSYEWSYYGEDEIEYVSVTFWNGIISDVGIEKRAY